MLPYFNNIASLCDCWLLYPPEEEDILVGWAAKAYTVTETIDISISPSPSLAIFNWSVK